MGGVAPGEECTACGVGGGGGGPGNGAMSYVGCGQGEYIQETTYKYVGCGGDFDTVRPRRDFTCLITSCCLLSLLLLIPLLCWLLSGLTSSTSLLYNCEEGFLEWETVWSQAQQEYCCTTMGRGCDTTRPTTALPETTPTVPPTPFPTPPPTPPPTTAPPVTLPVTLPPMTLPPMTLPPMTLPPMTPAPGPVDPFNCAVDLWMVWAPDKKTWCCTNHNICDGNPTQAPPPADPYNCAAGFENWQAGWSVPKKQWCCQHHGKACDVATGCVTAGPTSAPFDCEAGFANWLAGWSVAKKAWCCTNAGKGCPTQNGGCA